MLYLSFPPALTRRHGVISGESDLYHQRTRENMQNESRELKVTMHKKRMEEAKESPKSGCL